MKSMINQQVPGIKQSTVNGIDSLIIHHSDKQDDHHFLTDFGYQMVMITNNDSQAVVEISSNFPKQQKGYKIIFPNEN